MGLLVWLLRIRLCRCWFLLGECEFGYVLAESAKAINKRLGLSMALNVGGIHAQLPKEFSHNRGD
jgi:hypothetical protein